MGIMDLLLKKGRGIGELKDMGTEHSLNVNTIKLIKELNSLDKKMADARSCKNYKATLNGIQSQLSLINQIEYYALVRMIRLEYDYKDVNGRLNDFEKHYKNETKKLMDEKKKFFKSKKYKAYLNDYDSYSSIPAVQDIAEICYIKEKNLISDDAIIINGNSGDYISGGHLFQATSLNTNADDIWKQFLLKHYSLWGKLNTHNNHLLIVKQLVKMAESRKITDFLNSNDHPFFFEAVEFLERQSMYVVNQQEAYDFNNYDWRLPLWSDNFLSFWESVPFEYKFRQRLYSKVLYENNWGGVWQGMPINKKTIHPNWIVPLRFASKVCLSPLGKDYWHKFEKNVFQYWMDLTRNSVITPYHRVLLDNNGQKNMFSWLSKGYLEQKK